MGKHGNLRGVHITRPLDNSRQVVQIASFPRKAVDKITQLAKAMKIVIRSKLSQVREVDEVWNIAISYKVNQAT